MTPHDDDRLVGIAHRLDRLRWTPSAVLADAVLRDGMCMSASSGHEPSWADEPMTDRELAARMCAGCPVQDECLELDLRVAGEDTAGVWGALPEDDRRALYPHWLQRGERADGGGPR